MKDKVIRVATLNNFNFTAPEIKQVRELESKHGRVFVNCHAKTRLKDLGIPIVATLNPDVLKCPGLRGNTGSVAAVRVKYVHSAAGKEALEACFEYCSKHGFQPLITLFRMKRCSSLDRFVDPEHQGHYSWDHNFFRLTARGKRSAIRHLMARGRAWGLDVKFCDKSGGGCPECGNCSKLTFGQELPIYEVNLSSSGHCPYNCPDCFAKTLVTKNCGRIGFDRVKMNSKMKGKQS